MLQKKGFSLLEVLLSLLLLSSLGLVLLDKQVQSNQQLNQLQRYRQEAEVSQNSSEKAWLSLRHLW